MKRLLQLAYYIGWGNSTAVSRGIENALARWQSETRPDNHCAAQ